MQPVLFVEAVVPDPEELEPDPELLFESRLLRSDPTTEPSVESELPLIPCVWPLRPV